MACACLRPVAEPSRSRAIVTAPSCSHSPTTAALASLNGIRVE